MIANFETKSKNGRNMLDDLKMIHERDADDALGVVDTQWKQLQHKFDVELSGFEGVQNIVLAGMGGSAIPGVFLRVWPGTKVPFEVVRDYDLPEYVGPNTLFVSSSHSGNTEETLEGLRKAEEKGAKIIVTASGGKLAQLAKDKNYPLYEIPGGIQPRMCTLYFIAALVQAFEQLGLIDAGSSQELHEAAEWLNGQADSWKAEIPTDKNAAKQLAQELIGKSVVVYSGPKLFPAANKFKICLNENAKNVAWANQYPELNHNEFIGWTSHPVQKPYAVVEIRSSLEHPRVQKRFEVTERLLSGKRPAPLVITPQGDTVLKQILWASTFADFVSLYVALLNGLNPTPVALVEKLKQELG